MKKTISSDLSAMNEPIVILLDTEYKIQKISSEGVVFFRKPKSLIINQSFTELLLDNGINDSLFIVALQQSKKKLFKKIEFDYPKFKSKHLAIIIANENIKHSYSITIISAQDTTNGYLTSIINNLPGSVYWKNKDGQYLGCNGYVATMAGYENAKELIGMTDYDMCWHDFADEWRSLDLKVMNENSTIVREEQVKLANGKIITELTMKSPLKNERDEIVGIIGTSLDITDRKKMEEELRQAKISVEIASKDIEQAEAEKAAAHAKAEAEEEMRKTVMVLVGDIVHDLRTPIATIRTVASILSKIHPVVLEMIDELKELGGEKHNLLNKKKLDYMIENTPVTSIQESINLIDNFINTSLAELSSAQKAQTTELSLDDLIICSSRRVLENTLDCYPPLPSKIILHQNTSYDFFLLGNSILIMKILFNLIRNSIEQITLKHGGIGSITISTEESGEYNLLKIKDTGGGAPPDVTANFFKGYFTTKKNGTGIGLAVSKKMMLSFGGDLTYISHYGESMEFILSFPKIEDGRND